MGAKLAAERANADLSYQLATIKTDVELDAGPRIWSMASRP